MIVIHVSICLRWWNDLFWCKMTFRNKALPMWWHGTWQFSPIAGKNSVRIIIVYNFNIYKHLNQSLIKLIKISNERKRLDQEPCISSQVAILFQIIVSRFLTFVELIQENSKQFLPRLESLLFLLGARTNVSLMNSCRLKKTKNGCLPIIVSIRKHYMKTDYESSYPKHSMILII